MVAADWVSAYIVEYGYPPRTRGDHERANAFRYGYEAGGRAARIATLRDVASRLEDEADGPPPRH